MIKFNKTEDAFMSTLRSRIHDHFQSLGISSKGGRAMFVKTVFLFGLVSSMYTLILMDWKSPILLIGLYVLLALSAAVFSFGTLHDALHGTYLLSAKSNRAIGLLMDLLGGSSYFWKKEHTIDHHTFTNIEHHDADLRAPIIVRLCPTTPYRRFHAYQWLYAPFLYALNLFNWAYRSDPKRIFHTIRHSYRKEQKFPSVEIPLAILLKLAHIALFIGIPLLVLSTPWWAVIAGYIAYLLTIGLVLTTVFQLAHIVENVDFPIPDDKGQLESGFFVHQICTTANFAPKSKIVSFLCGGLNFQIEHHLFPHMCHMHLPKIAPIVEKTAKEFGLPYHCNPSFFAAVRSHIRLLKKLGQEVPTVFESASHT